MSQPVNHLGQPIGFPVADWSPRARPPRSPMVGHYCRLEPLDAACHGAELHRANREDRDGRIWTYLPYGPFETLRAFRDWIEAECRGDDPLYHAIVDLRSGTAVGVASFLRINPGVGVIEVGHINYAPPLQRTPAASEAMFLMMSRVFDQLGYRRYEWKCDALNAGSRRAAERLGFRFEGVFRQATLYKGRNRDTAWYAITDQDWPAIRSAFQTWLDPANFDPAGQQRRSLREIRGT
jgi:RimJ/RimL family protein N-acetyltransferase